MLVETATLRVREARAQILASKHLWAQLNRTRKLARASRSSGKMQGRLTSRSWLRSNAFKTCPFKIPLLREFPGKTQLRRRRTPSNTTALSSVNKDHKVSLAFTEERAYWRMCRWLRRPQSTGSTQLSRTHICSSTRPSVSPLLSWSSNWWSAKKKGAKR